MIWDEVEMNSYPCYNTLNVVPRFTARHNFRASNLLVFLPYLVFLKWPFRDVTGKPKDFLFMDGKICGTCGKWKPIDFYGILKSAKDGLRGRCRDCRKIEVIKRKEKQSEYNKKYYIDNYEKEKERHVAYCNKNREQINSKASNYYYENRQTMLERARIRRSIEREIMLERTRMWRNNNPQKVSDYSKKYRKENREQVNKNFRKYINQRKINDKEFAIKRVIRSRFKSLINKGSWRTIFCDGEFQYSDYVLHFDVNQPGMLDKYLKTNLYHIDHIIPVSAYNFETKSDIKKCWNPRNLRIIDKKLNMQKRNKVDKLLIEKYGITDLLPEGLKIV